MKRRRMTPMVALPAILVLSGCASFGRAKVATLTTEEQQYMTALKKAVADNQTEVQKALDDIGRIHDNAVATEQSLLLGAVAKAKLLESMKSPWVNAPTNMGETQRAVVLFHLYDLSQSELQAAEAARVQRATARTQIVAHWAHIGDLLGQALKNQEAILKDLNQPADQQLLNAVGNFLTDAKAFQAELAKSDDPELKRLASETDKALTKVDNAKDQLENVLKLVHTFDGSGASTGGQGSQGAPGGQGGQSQGGKGGQGAPGGQGGQSPSGKGGQGGKGGQAVKGGQASK
jgi:hypothetical protein